MTSVNTLAIAGRVHSGKLARSIIESIEFESAAIPEEFQEAFWEKLHLHIEKKLRMTQQLIPKSQCPMDECESREFGKQVLSVGPHRGMTVDEAPLEWIDKLCDSTFLDDLRRYRASDRVKSERRDFTDNEIIV